MWCQIISSSSQTAISPCDDYLPVTIFCPCPKVVIISDILCNTNHNKFIHGKDVHLWMIKYQSRHLKKCYLLDEVSGPEDKVSIINQLESGLSNGCIFSFNVELFFTSFRYIAEI